MHPEIVLIGLFSAAALVAILARTARMPYTVALVFAGLGLGAVHPVAGIHLTKELLYSVFLPGLLFEASYHLDFRLFRSNARTILALSIPGVIASIVVTASILAFGSRAVRLGEGFGWPQALVFSSLISATDPIAVVALFKTLGAPKRLGVLTEGESLINDGTSVVLFTIIYSIVADAKPLSIGAATYEFAKVAGVGCLLGGGLAFVIAQFIRRVDDPMIEITLTMVTAYGSFVLAEGFHFSGVIATVTAGMVCGNYAASSGMTETTRVALESFWEYVAFALNSIVFLLIGLELRLGALALATIPIVTAFVAVMLGRAAVVTATSAALRATTERIPWRWGVMLTWGGLRGALSMVLALALPAEFPQRELIVTMTFGVVLASIVVQGLTAGPLLRVLGLSRAANE